MEPNDSFDAYEYSDDTRIARWMRRLGYYIGHNPKKWSLISAFICLVLTVAGLSTRTYFGGSRMMMNPMKMELQWCVIGSKTEATVRDHQAKKEDSEAWFRKESTTMFVSKDEKIKDIATREAFEEMYHLYLQWTALEVTMEGKTYSMHDLCGKTIFPDIPTTVRSPYPNGLVLPCDVISPMMCFREGGDINHPTWQEADAGGEWLASGAPFSNRPSFRSMTDSQLKDQLSILWDQPRKIFAPGTARGCRDWRNATYFVDLWAGKTVWNATKLKHVGAMRMIFYMDGPARIAYRLRHDPAKAHLADIETIERVQEKMSELWHQTAQDYNRQTRILEVTNVEDFETYTAKRLTDTQSQMKWGQVLSGGGLMLAYIVFALVSYAHPQASRVNLGFIGLGCVFVAEVTAGSVYLLTGMYLNAPMLIGMPLLALGLGVDDMFVFIRYFSNLGLFFITDNPPSKVIAELLAQAGPGTTLTSFCNVCTFAIGSYLPIPAMADFCVCAGVVSLTNYLVMINLFVPCMVAEIERIVNLGPDPTVLTYFCHKRVLREAEDKEDLTVHVTSSTAAGKRGGIEYRAIRFMKETYAPLMMRPCMRVVTLFFLFGMLGAAGYMLKEKRVGYAPWELFPHGSSYERGMELMFKEFSLFPAALVVKDLDVAMHQAEILKVYADLSLGVFSAPSPLVPYIFALTIAGNKYAGPLCKIPGLPEESQLNVSIWCDQNYTHPVFAPLGLVPAEEFDTSFNTWREMPANPFDELMSGELDFVFADTFGSNLFAYEKTPRGNTSQRITYSQMPYFLIFPYQEGVNNEDFFIDAIKESQAIIEKSPVAAHLAGFGSVTTFWEVFLYLDTYLSYLVAAGSLVIFFVSCVVFSFDVPVAAATGIACGLIIVQVYGFSAYFMNFNIFVATVVLMGLGIAVEFTAHFAAAFSSNKDEPDLVVRMGEAMAHSFPALVEGSVSTLMGVLPLAFSPELFTVKYLFGIMSLVVVVGLTNGLFIMPGLISVFSPLIIRMESGRCCLRKSKVHIVEPDDDTPRKEHSASSFDTSPSVDEYPADLRSVSLKGDLPPTVQTKPMKPTRSSGRPTTPIPAMGQVDSAKSMKSTGTGSRGLLSPPTTPQAKNGMVKMRTMKMTPMASFDNAMEGPVKSPRQPVDPRAVALPEDPENEGFAIGLRVHIWSNSAGRWFEDGVIIEVAMRDFQAEGTMLPAGSVLVAYQSGASCKWVPLMLLNEVLRLVPVYHSAEAEWVRADFAIGDRVRIWSNTSGGWIDDGVVIEISARDFEAEGHNVPAGSVLVAYAAGTGCKWVPIFNQSEILQKAPPPLKAGSGRSTVQ